MAKNVFRWGSAPSRSEFESLLRPHLSALFGTALRLTGRPEEAEDLVQELLLKLFPQSGVLASVDVLGPWLKRALYNLFVDRRRTHDRSPFARLHDADADTLLEALESEGSDPEHLEHRRDLQQRLYDALGTLSAEHRAVLVLHDMEGHTLNEISAMLRIPLGTLKSRLFRARRGLRELFGGRNLLPAADVLEVEDHEHDPV